MLTVETIKKAVKQYRKQTRDAKYYYFISQELGEKFGLEEGQMVDDIQIIFTKKIKAA